MISVFLDIYESLKLKMRFSIKVRPISLENAPVFPYTRSASAEKFSPISYTLILCNHAVIHRLFPSISSNKPPRTRLVAYKFELRGSLNFCYGFAGRGAQPRPGAIIV